MKATEAKELAYKAISKEKEEMLKLIKAEAAKGALRLEFTSPLSDACKKSLTEDGYVIKMVLEIAEEKGNVRTYSISWEGK